ncbi:MAG: trypsin-like serine protease [Pseudomonadota bacterium]
MGKNILLKSLISGALAIGLASTASAQEVEMSGNGRAVAYSPAFAPANKMTSSQMSSAKSRMPMLTSLSQLPEASPLRASGSGFSTQAFGSGTDMFGGIPFTSRIVAQRPNSNTNSAPVDQAPYRQTGKLFMNFDGLFFVCSASVIRPGLVLTAAHCVHDFGQGEAGFADEVFFQPARHNDDLPYGEWTVQRIIIPGVYFNGTDECVVTGIVCENDVAILVMDANEEGEEVGEVVGRYGLYQNDRGYTPLGAPDGQLAAHLTQVSYPQASFTGVRMIQAESVAIQDAETVFGPGADFNQVVMGSNMTGGSSGGPWIHNFGKNDGSTGTPAVDSNRNRVAAVTSWGFIDDSIKLQGASRFGHNTAFPPNGPTNVRTLINFGCSFGPSKC